MIENTIIKGVAAVALGLGLLANYEDYGLAAATIYAAFLLLILSLFVWQVRCVVYGGCHLTAWTTVGLALATFGSLAYYYWQGLQPGHQTLAQLEYQPIATANPVIAEITRQARDRFNVDLLRYINRPARASLGHT